MKREQSYRKIENVWKEYSQWKRPGQGSGTQPCENCEAASKFGAGDGSLLSQLFWCLERRPTKEQSHRVIDKTFWVENSLLMGRHTWRCSEYNWLFGSNLLLLLQCHLYRKGCRRGRGQGEWLYQRTVIVHHSCELLLEFLLEGAVKTDQLGFIGIELQSMVRCIIATDVQHGSQSRGAWCKYIGQCHMHNKHSQQTNFSNNNQHHNQSNHTKDHPSKQQRGMVSSSAVNKIIIKISEGECMAFVMITRSFLYENVKNFLTSRYLFLVEKLRRRTEKWERPSYTRFRSLLETGQEVN